MEVSIDYIEKFWNDNAQYTKDLPAEVNWRANPRFVEYPYQQYFFDKFQPNRVVECGCAHIDRDFFKIYWDLILGKTEAYGIDIAAVREDRFSHLVSKESLQAWDTRVADMRDTGFDDDFFNMILCISTIEHVGFEVGRTPTEDAPYSIDRNVEYAEFAEDHEEDLKAFAELVRITGQGDHLVITVPYENTLDYFQCKDSLGFTATNIVYDKARLNKLIESAPVSIIDLSYYYLDADSTWKESPNGEIPSSSHEGLACFIVQKG